jgi:hypothetical protein
VETFLGGPTYRERAQNQAEGWLLWKGNSKVMAETVMVIEAGG